MQNSKLIEHHHYQQNKLYSFTSMFLLMTPEQSHFILIEHKPEMQRERERERERKREIKKKRKRERETERERER